MGKTKAEKERKNRRSLKKRKLGLKFKKKQKNSQNSLIQENDPVLFGGADGDSDSDPAPSPDRIQNLLDPYTKDQLIGFLLDAAATDPTLVDRIRSVADADVSHRKIFVHGLGWDTTRETVLEVFSAFGPVEECNVVVDKATGRAKGYGFVLFKTRGAAVKALRQPQKQIKNRVASCQLASVGPVPFGGGAASSSSADGRKIYVSNVYADAPPDKLKALFAKFGEIESGPIGYDMLTGKSRGFAIFVYKNQEGAKRALEEPYKMFEGHQLHCQLATDSSQKGKAVAVATMPPTVSTAPAVPAAALMGAVPQPVLAAVAAAQNLALYNQNPAYGALLAQNPLLAAAAMNPTAAMNPMVGQVYGGVGVGGGAPSVLGAYGTQGTAGFQGLQGLQGLQSYQGSQLGQQFAARPGTSFGGLQSYQGYM